MYFHGEVYIMKLHLLPSKEGSREESLYLINEALNGVFTGYKGGCYTYNIYTKVHFENNISSCDDLALYQLLLNE